MRRAAILIMTCLAVAACGDSGDPAPGATSGSGGTSPGGTSSGTSAPGDSTTTPGGGGTSDLGGGVVNIGDHRYEFITDSSAFGACELPSVDDPELFRLHGWILSDPSDRPTVGTPEIFVNLPLSHEDVDLEMNWNHLGFSVDLSEEEHWTYYHPRDIGQLDQEAGGTAYADSYPGIGSWTVTGDRASGEVALKYGQGGDIRIVTATFDFTCPG